MPKHMNNRYILNLQLFAEDNTGDNTGDGDDQDDDSEDETDENGENEVKFTQADIDKAIARTIAKERAKAERAAKRKAKNEQEDGSEEDKEKREAISKASKLEVKVACFEADVSKDSVDDVAALAHAYMEMDDSLDLEDAIEKVVKKYPHFKNKVSDNEEETRQKSWGERQNGKKQQMSGVEAAFLKKNPGLKI